MSTPFISAQSLGTLRNNFSGNVGFQFNPSVDVTVDSIGRWVVSGNSATHQLEIWNITDNVQVATVTVDCNGASAGAYLYGSITPVTLLSTKHYSIQSAESSGGDQWYDSDTTVTPDSGLGSVPNAIFNHTNTNSTTNHSYGPVNFKTTGTVDVNETLSDSLTLTDSVTVELDVVIEEVLSDSLTLTDSASVALVDLVGLDYTFNDTLALSDTISVFVDLVLTFSDLLTLSDSILTSGSLILIKSDLLTLLDSLIIHGQNDKEFSDRLILSDLMILSAPAASTIGDTVVLSDSARIVLELNLVIGDSLDFSDDNGIQLVDVIELIIGDLMVMSDSIAVLTSTNDTNYLRAYLNDVQGVRTPESISDPTPETPDPLNDYLRRYLNDVS